MRSGRWSSGERGPAVGGFGSGIFKVHDGRGATLGRRNWPLRKDAVYADGGSRGRTRRRLGTASQRYRPTFGLCLDQTPGADHVVGQDLPQDDSLDLPQAAPEELRQSSIARLSVGTFSGRRTPSTIWAGKVRNNSLSSPDAIAQSSPGTQSHVDSR